MAILCLKIKLFNINALSQHDDLNNTTLVILLASRSKILGAVVKGFGMLVFSIHKQTRKHTQPKSAISFYRQKVS